MTALDLPVATGGDSDQEPPSFRPETPLESAGHPNPTSPTPPPGGYEDDFEEPAPAQPVPAMPWLAEPEPDEPASAQADAAPEPEPALPAEPQSDKNAEDLARRLLEKHGPSANLRALLRRPGQAFDESEGLDLESFKMKLYHLGVFSFTPFDFAGLFEEVARREGSTSKASLGGLLSTLSEFWPTPQQESADPPQNTQVASPSPTPAAPTPAKQEAPLGEPAPAPATVKPQPAAEDRSDYGSDFEEAPPPGPEPSQPPAALEAEAKAPAVSAGVSQPAAAAKEERYEYDSDYEEFLSQPAPAAAQPSEPAPAAKAEEKYEYDSDYEEFLSAPKPAAAEPSQPSAAAKTEAPAEEPSGRMPLQHYASEDFEEDEYSEDELDRKSVV